MAKAKRKPTTRRVTRPSVSQQRYLQMLDEVSSRLVNAGINLDVLITKATELVKTLQHNTVPVTQAPVEEVKPQAPVEEVKPQYPLFDHHRVALPKPDEQEVL